MSYQVTRREYVFVRRLRQLMNKLSKGHVVISWEGGELSWESEPKAALLELDKEEQTVVK